MHKFSYMVTLTYNNETEQNRLGSVTFRYSDVSAFLKRLATQLREKHGVASPRFVCAGEKGSKRGRVHWHLIVFSDAQIIDAGRWMKYGRAWEGPRMGKRNRLDWSLWPYGFAEIQEANDNRCAYVLKYAFKDQFATHRAEGTIREDRAEQYATGLFRMSKGRGRGQAIGEPWLYGQVDALLERGQWPVKLEFSPPDYSGYWRVSGTQRKNLLDYLFDHALSLERKPAQWDAFLASLSEKELERWTGHGEEVEQAEYEARKRDADDDSQIREHARNVQAIRRKCGARTPCEGCVKALSDAAFVSASRISSERSDLRAPVKGPILHNETTVHPFCLERGQNGWAFRSFAGLRTSKRSTEIATEVQKTPRWE